MQPNRDEIQRALGLDDKAATTLEEMVVARGGRRRETAAANERLRARTLRGLHACARRNHLSLDQGDFLCRGLSEVRRRAPSDAHLHGEEDRRRALILYQFEAGDVESMLERLAGKG